MFNIYFLIGHGGSGKSLYGKSVEEYFDNKDSSIVYYDEDNEVAKIAGYSSFSELLENETQIQKFYNKFTEKLIVEAEKRKNEVFVVSTGGYSVLIDDSLYKNGYKIYIKSALKDILKSVDERSKLGIHFLIIKGFETVPKKLEFKKFEIDLFIDYFYKADDFYTSMTNLLIENKHNDKDKFQKNIKKIVDKIKTDIKMSKEKSIL